MVGYVSFGKIFTTTPMSFGMHMTAIGLGLGSWAVQAIVKATSDKLVYKMPVFGEDEAALQSTQSVVASYSTKF